MRDLYSKTNAPYLIAGAVATLVLLASGTLAVAPYVEFLSSVAAFNVALPIALSLSILSILVLVLSCKIISNNKKIEVERNKFAQKEQELENKIALGKEAKEAASKEVEELNNQLNKLTREKQDADRVIEGLNKKVSQLECEKNNSLHYAEELRDENARLSEREDSLMEKLSQPQKEIDSLKRQLDELKSEEILALVLGEKITELETCLEKKRKKIGELAVQLKKDKTSSLEEKLEDSEKREKELRGKLFQLNEEKEKLEDEISDKHQEHIYLNSEIDKLYTREKGYLSKIKELEKELSSFLKEDKEELVDESMKAKDGLKGTINKFEEKEREYVTEAVFAVLSVVKERVEQGLFGEEEGQYTQDTDRIQEGVDEFMQPIYRKLNIDNQQKFNGCTTTLKQLQNLLTAPCIQLADFGCTSGCSTRTNSYHTF